jgi:DNA replication protein DnaC
MNKQDDEVEEIEIEICSLCFGSGMEIVPGKGARRCACRMPKAREEVLQKIPERNRRYGIPVLAELKPRVPEEHENQTTKNQERIIKWQSKLIRYLQANPFASINLCGSNKIGKSHLAYSLFLNSFEKYRRVRCFNLEDYLIDFAKFKRGDPDPDSDNRPWAHPLPKDLLVGEKWTILIDEFHMPLNGLTEPQSKAIFELIDAIKGCRQQLIVLSNYSMSDLRTGYSKFRTEVGDSITSRLHEEAVTEELFLTEMKEIK